MLAFDADDPRDPASLTEEADPIDSSRGMLQPLRSLIVRTDGLCEGCPAVSTTGRNTASSSASLVVLDDRGFEPGTHRISDFDVL